MHNELLFHPAKHNGKKFDGNKVVVSHLYDKDLMTYLKDLVILLSNEVFHNPYILLHLQALR